MSVPRRKQPALTIRSIKAIEYLGMISDGRSQARIIEDALQREVALNRTEMSLEDRQHAIREIQAEVAEHPLRFASMADFDRHEYDERGSPR